MGDHVITPEPEHIFITPLGFHLYASDFLAAANEFKCPDRFSPVPYSLYCRSIELTLKAFLLGKGLSKEELKDRNKFGHDLVNLINRARDLGIETLVNLSPARLECVRKANGYYESKTIEYFDITFAVSAYPDLPALDVLKELASDLVCQLKQYCLDVS